MRGDPSDNLPGVRGIGPRTATRLLRGFGCARAAFDDLDRVRVVLGGAVAGRVAAPGARAAWELNCQVMAMRTDVALDLDLRRGPGVLPLPADAVSRAFYGQNLTWTARDALRVLAELEPGAPAPREPLPAWVESWPSGGARPRLPRLPRRPEPAQLTLFD